MSPSWFWAAALACATFWNTKVSSKHAVPKASSTHGATDTKVVYRRYASLFFVCGIGSADNELVTLEIIHRYVEVLDRYFGNVSRFAFKYVSLCSS